MLYIVSTPIGNLKDITLRALEVLKEADIVFAEDTRKAAILFKRYAICRPLLSFHEHNKAFRTKKALTLLKEGKKLALISEAGTPGISDPGFYLVRACIQESISFTAIPGPSAVVNALILSGLPTDSFYFAGFLPSKKGRRKRRLKELSSLSTTLIFFESPHRIISSLQDIKEWFARKQIAVVREMTKVYEEVIRGIPEDVLLRLQSKHLRGEFVIVIDNR